MSRAEDPNLARAVAALWRAVFTARFSITLVMVVALAYVIGGDRARLHNQQDRTPSAQQYGQAAHALAGPEQAGALRPGAPARKA